MVEEDNRGPSILRLPFGRLNDVELHLAIARFVVDEVFAEGLLSLGSRGGCQN